MVKDFLNRFPVAVNPEDLVLPRARLFAAAVRQPTWQEAVRLIETRRSAGAPDEELVIIDVEVERGQIRAVETIHGTERVGVVFHAADDRHPDVLALRDDFPWLSHLTIKEDEIPRGLCLFEESWPELKRDWTPKRFVGQIQHWLSATVAGTLHRDDQSLEPLFAWEGDWIVLPRDLLTTETRPTQLLVERVGSGSRFVLVARAGKGKPSHVAAVIVCGEQQHGLVRRAPQNLKELHEALAATGFDLVGAVRQRLLEYLDSGSQDLLAAKLILLLLVPKTRVAGGKPEEGERWAFATPLSVRDAGVEVGAWALADGQPGRLFRVPDDKNGGNVLTLMLRPVFEFSRAMAAACSGEVPSNQQYLAIGAGALGSQVLINFARSGFGVWTIIDEDLLLPHNLARHALPGDAVGFPKAPSMAVLGNALYEGFARGIVADLLRPRDKEAEVASALTEAAAVLDMAGSIAVSRHLARDAVSGARRIAMFQNPSGTDLVLLAEDAGRRIRLDALEMQYYREVATNDRLQEHLYQAKGSISYAKTCRDVSFTVPQDFVAMLSGIGSHAFKFALASEAAAIRIWHVNPETLAVDSHEVIPAPVREVTSGDWVIVYDELLNERLLALRTAKLPRETGGVLVGSCDVSRHIVYVVDALSSPVDSLEGDGSFVRGAEDLARQVGRLRERTGQNLEYIGEWHSHPDGIAALPSGEDLAAIVSSTREMSEDGLPFVMAIVGEDGPRFCLGEVPHA